MIWIFTVGMAWLTGVCLILAALLVSTAGA